MRQKTRAVRRLKRRCTFASTAHRVHGVQIF